jgi:hypothetical protein
VLIKVVLFAIFTYRSDPVPWLLNCKSFGVSGVTTRDRLFRKSQPGQKGAS